MRDRPVLPKLSYFDAFKSPKLLQKIASFEGLSEVWGSMDTPQRAAAIIGAGILGHQLYKKLSGSEDTGWLMPVLGALATGYGISGGQPSNLLPNLYKIVNPFYSNSPSSSSGQPAAEPDYFEDDFSDLNSKSSLNYNFDDEIKKK